MTLIPIKGQDGFFRDSETNAIVNKNNNDFKMYVNNRERLSKDQERLSHMERSMDDLKHDLDDIKALLKNLLR